MRCFISTSTNPYFNLATEEYLLKNCDEEIFLIYINEPCIVVGKHQNLLAEINLQYVLENKIRLARRISGGGTVYQDFNNLNFSFIHNCKNLEEISFTRFTNPILEALLEMGLDVSFSGRNDLLIDSKKISGNAMHILKTRVLSHGTLLFNADLSKLSLALKTNPQKYIDKAIKSVRSKVTNISDYLENAKPIDDFKNTIFQSITGKMNNHSSIKPLTDLEIESIGLIVKSKFETWDWIYGYSPNYIFRNNIILSNLSVQVELHVEKSVIKRVNTDSDQTQSAGYQEIFDTLINVKHEYITICELLKQNPAIHSISPISITEFCKFLF
ncbi:MAG TPA: lipoate--protein ligase [Prolixibacteraceae bacterium]|jgi:lipoate-protein ligase A